MTPITRREMFMAKAAGEDVPTLEPVTREEYFLSQISGGGGLPEIGEGDEGKVLTVDDGAAVWAEASGAMEVDANTYTVGTLSWDGSTTGRDTATMSMAGGMLTFTGYKISDDTDISLISGSAKGVVEMNDVYPMGAVLKGDNYESFVYADNSYNMVSALVARGTSISGEAFGYSFTITCQSTGVYFINTVAAGSPMECKYTKAVAGKAAAGTVIEKPVYDGMAYFHRVASDVTNAWVSGMFATVGAKYKINWKDEDHEVVAVAAVDSGYHYVRLSFIKNDHETEFDFPTGGGSGNFYDGNGYEEGYTPLKIWELETAKIPAEDVDADGGILTVGTMRENTDTYLDRTFADITAAFYAGKVVHAFIVDGDSTTEYRLVYTEDSRIVGSDYNTLVFAYYAPAYSAFKYKSISVTNVADYPLFFWSV